MKGHPAKFVSKKEAKSAGGMIRVLPSQSKKQASTAASTTEGKADSSAAIIDLMVSVSAFDTSKEELASLVS